MLEVAAQISGEERKRLEALEETVRANLQVFYEVGMALAEIRDSRLYRETHATFEDYCRERWDMSRIHAFRMIEAAATCERLLPIGNIPSSESQARPLTRLEPEQQVKAWEMVVETAPNGKVTAKHVQSVVRQIIAKGPKENGGVAVATKAKCAPKKIKETYDVSDAIDFATMAISQLERIRDDDPRRFEALGWVETWVKNKISEMKEEKNDSANSRNNKVRNIHAVSH